MCKIGLYMSYFSFMIDKKPFKEGWFIKNPVYTMLYKKKQNIRLM